MNLTADEIKERHRQASSAYYHANAKAIIEKQRAKRLANLEESRRLSRDAGKRWNEKNPEKRKAAQVRYDRANRHKPLQWAAENRERSREIKSKWAKANPQKIREKTARAYRANPLPMLFRERVRAAIKSQKGKKFQRTEVLIGCPISQARAHLESLFKPGMNWENHGRDGWHIDHIVPVSSFDLKTEEGQRQAFHFTNLQPLWKSENMEKGAKVMDCQPELCISFL